jgi:hypothetical protein
MKLSIAIACLAAALSSTETMGFVSRSTSSSSPCVLPTTTDGFNRFESVGVLAASADPNISDNESPSVDQCQQQVQFSTSSATGTKTAAMSLLMATVLSVSAAATMTSSTVFPVEAAWAASSATTTTATTTTTAATKSPKAAPAPAPVAPPLSNEEKERLAAKKNLDLSQQTLKEYQKYVSDAKQADKKASSEFTTASKAAEAAKKQYVAASDKLSAAKSQKMPTTAIQELSRDAGTLFFDFFPRAFISGDFLFCDGCVIVMVKCDNETFEASCMCIPTTLCEGVVGVRRRTGVSLDEIFDWTKNIGVFLFWSACQEGDEPAKMGRWFPPMSHVFLPSSRSLWLPLFVRVHW